MSLTHHASQWPQPKYKMTKIISQEEIIIRKVKNGDTLAFEELFNKYYQKLKQFTYQFTKSEFIAEEIVQEVFINLWVKRDKIDLNLSFNGYIYRITRNLLINHLKKMARDEKALEEFWYNMDKEKDNVSEQILDKEYNQHLEEAIDKLPKQKQLIFRLSREEGKSHYQIAEELGISKNTVKNHMVAAIKAIKNYLQTNADIQ